MTYQVGILGASGYTGAELLRLLAGHPDLEVAIVTAESNAGARIADLYPALAPVYGDRRYEPSEPGLLAGLDAVFCGLPHGESQKLLPELVDAVTHLLDLGADFRLPSDEYERWYGHAHGCPELLDRFTFGLVELGRDAIRAGEHVAVPGCYPTAVSLALAPLVSAGLIDPATIIADCASGVTGAGRSLKTTSLFGEVDANFSAYGLLTHRHTAEMELALGALSPSGEAQVLFTPHLAPMSRGILATCYARPAPGVMPTTESLLAVMRDFYPGEPFVTITDEPIGTKATFGSNSVHLTARFDERTGTVLALGCLDNLVKGASGQAIQCANLVFDLPETAGLPLVGLAP
jgi:N-acetyl-gamma-glutamyl-phosphate reductase